MTVFLGEGRRGSISAILMQNRRLQFLERQLPSRVRPAAAFLGSTVARRDSARQPSVNLVANESCFALAELDWAWKS
jgi:hypothetical protein